MQRIRIRYAKRGRLRFASHRDFQRAFERALRRAEVPMAYSAGFRPHPKISFANAAPTGGASEAEYLEIGLSQTVDPDWLRAALDQAMPDGLDIVEAVEAGPGDLASRLEVSEWIIELPQVDTQLAQNAAKLFMAQADITVERMTKKGTRAFDARAAVVDLSVDSAPEGVVPCAILRMVVTHGTPSVRPDDVLAALRIVADLAPPVPPRITRLAQGRLVADAQTDVQTISDPLAPDRNGRTRPEPNEPGPDTAIEGAESKGNEVVGD